MGTVSLCAQCTRFDIQSFRRLPWSTRGFRAESIVQAARNSDCHFCHFLYKVLQDIQAASTRPAPPSKDLYLHIQMSHDNDWLSSNSRPSTGLGYNMMSFFLGPRHLYNTSKDRIKMSMRGLYHRRDDETIVYRVLAEASKCPD